MPNSKKFGLRNKKFREGFKIRGVILIKYQCSCGNNWETTDITLSETCPKCKSRLFHMLYYEKNLKKVVQKNDKMERLLGKGTL